MSALMALGFCVLMVVLNALGWFVFAVLLRVVYFGPDPSNTREKQLFLQKLANDLLAWRRTLNAWMIVWSLFSLLATSAVFLNLAIPLPVNAILPVIFALEAWWLLGISGTLFQETSERKPITT